MEILQRYQKAFPTGLGAYLGLQRALMRRYVARGGTEEDFCARLAPVFHRRYAGILLEKPIRIYDGGEPQPAGPRRDYALGRGRAA
jgi:hypothetical protein